MGEAKEEIDYVSVGLFTGRVLLGLARSCRAYLSASCGIALLFAAGFVRSPQQSDPASWTVDQWVAWRDAQIGTLLEPTLPHGGEMVLSRQEVIGRALGPYAVIAGCLEKDPRFFDLKTERGRRMSHFAEFVIAQHWMSITGSDGKPAYALGYPIPDRRYVEECAESFRFPELLMSQRFLSAMTSRKTLNRAVAMIEAQNAGLPPDRRWVILPFLSQFIKSVDRTTYGRLLVFVPGQPAPDGRSLDRWVNFGIATPDTATGTEPRSVSIVSVVHGSGANEGKATLMDFLRETDPATGQIELTPTPLLRDNPSNNCYDCHKTALIPIKPEQEYTLNPDGDLKPAATNETSDALNAKMRAYGPLRLACQLPTSYGPSIGPLGRERSEDFIRAASGAVLSTESVQRIRASMNCASCHDAIGPINYPLAVRSSRDVLAFKTDKGLVESYIEKGYMPPGNTLTDAERHALWLCVSKEYYNPHTRSGVFVDWLRGTG